MSWTKVEHEEEQDEQSRAAGRDVAVEQRQGGREQEQGAGEACCREIEGAPARRQPSSRSRRARPARSGWDPVFPYRFE